MGLKGFYKRYENRILASVLLLALLLFVGIRYDYYYDLNDDVVMKDTLSGVYTGVPEGHNIQMLYPLSLVISLLYRIFPKLSVYGIFLCLCQYGSIWLMAGRSLRFGRNTWMKTGMVLAEGVVLFALLLPHLVFVQYTFVSAVLAAAAAFLFITAKEDKTGSFVRKSIPSILLAVLSYMLRTEMLLLLMPLICVAGVYRWSLEEKIFTKDNVMKYMAVIGGILMGMLVTWGINAAAFGSQEWKEYVAYFNSRTELYDYQGIPPYEGNEELYESLGLRKSEQDMLLAQYNLGLEDALEAGDLDRISEYQAAHKKAEQSFMALLAENLKLYRYRSFHKEPEGSETADDYPWNLLVIVGYIAVFLVMLGKAIWRKNWRGVAAGVGTLIFLFCVRTVLWMFILVRGRDPVRVTHSLYLMELCILFAMLCVEAAVAGFENRLGFAIGEKKRKILGVRTKVGGSVFVFLLIVFIGCRLDKECMADTDKEYQARAVANTVDGGMKEYCRNHPENFYFFDVYSAVSYPSEPYASTPYSEKMFAEVDNRLGNYDIMGGWLVKSPAFKKKLETFEITSMRNGLLYQEKVYLMAELSKGIEAFEAYFADQGADAELELVDTICDVIGVYKIRIAEEKRDKRMEAADKQTEGG